MKRRVCMAALAAVFLLSAVPLSPAARAFSDTGGHWAQADIDKARDYGLMEGYPDGRFGVEDQITRAEFVTVLCRMFGWDMLSPSAPAPGETGAWQCRTLVPYRPDRALSNALVRFCRQEEIGCFLLLLSIFSEQTCLAGM